MKRFDVSRMCDRAGAVTDQDGRVVVKCCYLAQGPLQRLTGLLGTPALRHGCGLWLKRCGSVHTWGMAFRIDVAFLSADGCVVQMDRDLPARRLRRVAGAQSVLETPASGLTSVNVGDVLRLLTIGARSGELSA